MLSKSEMEFLLPVLMVFEEELLGGSIFMFICSFGSYLKKDHLTFSCKYQTSVFARFRRVFFLAITKNHVRVCSCETKSVKLLKYVQNITSITNAHRSRTVGSSDLKFGVYPRDTVLYKRAKFGVRAGNSFRVTAAEVD